jgi:uncharacterized protein YjbI with pentapeptide repeats
MDDLAYFEILRQGSVVWNNWRKQHPEVQLNLGDVNLRKTYLRIANLAGVDLSGADLSEADLSEADLSRANLLGAKLSGANLYGANLSVTNLGVTNLSKANLTGANLTGADLNRAILYKANLSRANLTGADLSRAILREADLSRADLHEVKLSRANLSGAVLIRANLSRANLSGADLSRTFLIGTNLTNATLKDCKIYGISAWDVQLDGAEQFNLTITPTDQPPITVDNLKIAQFIYLLLNNQEIREVINTLTTKAVLILGRFSHQRKTVLDAIRMELRKQDYLPILFDFGRTSSQTVRETVRTLAQISYFIIADLTEQSSIPEELENIIPGLVVPVIPILATSQEREFSMFRDYGVYDWVLPIFRYADIADLLTHLQEQIIEPATQKALIWTEKKRKFED